MLKLASEEYLKLKDQVNEWQTKYREARLLLDDLTEAIREKENAEDQIKSLLQMAEKGGKGRGVASDPDDDDDF